MDIGTFRSIPLSIPQQRYATRSLSGTYQAHILVRECVAGAGADAAMHKLDAPGHRTAKVGRRRPKGIYGRIRKSSGVNRRIVKASVGNAGKLFHIRQAPTCAAGLCRGTLQSFLVSKRAGCGRADIDAGR